MNIKKYSEIICVCFLASLIALSPIIAQEETPTETVTEEAAQEEPALEEIAEEEVVQEKKTEALKVVVTGTKTERRLKDAPVRTTLITSKEIEQKGAENLYDILEGIPAIRVEEQCSYCNFSILRIMGMSSGNSLILIDGQPVYTGLAGVYGLQQIQSGTIQQIEIVKGAGSCLYGSEAIAGVINIITKEPPVKSTVEMSATYGSYNDGKFSIFASKREGDLAAVVSLQKSFGNEIDQDNDGYTDRVLTDNFSGIGKLYWYNPVSFIDRVMIFGSCLNEFRKGGDLTDNNWDNPFAEASEHIKTTRYETGFNIIKNLAAQNTINVNFHYSTHKRDATNDAAQDEVFHSIFTNGEPNPDITTPVSNASQLPFPFIANEKIYVGDVNYSHPLKLAGKHILLTGVQYKRSDFNQMIGQKPSETRMKTTKEADDYGIYLQDEYSPIKKLTIVGGVRYDKHHSVEHYDIGDNKYDTESINPRGAVKYSFTEDLTVRGSVGKGFRVPYHFDEEMHLCSGSPKIAKPKELDPEKSLTYSASVDFIKENKYYAGASYTRIDVKDKIAFEPTDISGYDYEWKNAGDAYSQAIEIESGVTPVKNLLKIDASFTYLDAQYKKNPYEEIDEETWGDDAEGSAIWTKYKDRGKYIPRVPEHSASISVNVTPGTFSFFVSGTYTGPLYIEYFEDDEVLREIKKTENFWVTDIRIAKSFADNKVEIFAGSKNLFDYFQKDKRPDNAAFMWAPYTGRKVYGGCKIKF